MKKSVLFTFLLIIINFSCTEKQDEVVDVSSKTDKENGIKKLGFYEKGKLKKTFEYVNVCGKEYVNQGWHFNEKGDTLEQKSHFCKIKIEKNILKPLEESKVTMIYKPLLKNTVSGILLCKEDNINYCDLENKKFDTLYFVKNKLEFIQSFRHTGHKKLTGYVLEISKELRADKRYQERRVYFTLNFTVK
ncbi:hypothetical protein [Flavobacterium wongokense]|uniref:hypothetical protein n=1 Tax=Flavobacterium wongokense TaxID=2910674 RepID=UPI001F476FAD|nr:hypothetical protein [Flavobacterium sp. WG47]MCF6133460.1 hypothetical protein [Flavobacterium sp. WG47]